MGVDHVLQWRGLVGRAWPVVQRKSAGRRDSRGHGGRAVRGHTRPHAVRVRRPRERRVRVRHLVQTVPGSPGELGRSPLRRPVPQYPVNAAHRWRRAVRAHSCEHAQNISSQTNDNNITYLLS